MSDEQKPLDFPDSTGGGGMMASEKPILFSGEMVRAILDGRKVQTRRVIKPQPELRPGTMLGPTRKRIDTAYWHWKDEWWWQDPQPSMLAQCPYGKYGDLLWVRETWAIERSSYSYEYGWEVDGVVEMGIPKTKPSSKGLYAIYRADGDNMEDGERWKPSIFMPRWASRIALEIASVKVERVQDISEDDAKAEGVWTASPDMMMSGVTKNHIGAFRLLWDGINGKRPGCAWADNPHVWCISFRRVPPPT